jgi:hypothetical protein
MEVSVLHKTSKMRGFRIHATDGEIGHVEEFLVDEDGWTVRYLVVDTSNWLGGRSVLISSAMVDSIDSPKEEIRVRLTRVQIENSPSVETAEIELVETLPSVWIL